MATGSVVADFTALEGLTGVSNNDWMLVASAGYGCYVHDSDGTAAANGDITRVHGAGGRWYAVKQIYSATAPTGACQLPCLVLTPNPASTGNDMQLWGNTGGGSADWEQIY
ncbi:MAG: hypothetical protein AAF959_11310 [Cyanobacteria bacterium P01_D01_bin.56]